MFLDFLASLCVGSRLSGSNASPGLGGRRLRCRDGDLGAEADVTESQKRRT